MSWDRLRRRRSDAGQVLEELRRRRVALLGLGVSHEALARFLAGQGVTVTVLDRKPPEALAPRLERLRGLAVNYRLGEAYQDGLRGHDLIFLTPGARPDEPIVGQAVAGGAELSSEIELLLLLCRAPVLGITGSAGKTTTTALIGAILERAGRPVRVGGNIGRPLIEEALSIDPGEQVVLEMSSFQLELLTVSPEIAVLLNLRPNHLDAHQSMDAYVAAKTNIYRHQQAGGWAVFNADEPRTRELGSARTAGTAWFSALDSVEPGAYLADGLVWLNREPVCPAADLALPGRHNLENFLAATAASALAGAPAEAIARAGREFPGVPHRLELVGEVGGVRYVNDSIATAPDRTAAALATLPGPILLVLGGYDKKVGFAELAHLILGGGKVRRVFLTGPTADQIERALTQAAEETGLAPPPHERHRRYDELLPALAAAARPGDTVLLSPACASFDSFANFEERGDLFRRFVATLAARA
ncbi:MAG: UDP-N-acetylmuramoyl-L-alanine--D-glutamate ligase [bacterium]|nr:UDP-N-acetylmuramoyl-L-alanine--D-glutamate ligase [bacterium]